MSDDVEFRTGEKLVRRESITAARGVGRGIRKGRWQGMGVRRRLAVFCAKLTDRLIRRLKMGNGGSFPGYVARLVDPQILSRLADMVREKVIVVVGTNGKTTTTSILCHVLEAEGKKVVTNRMGANMLNGIVTGFVLAADKSGNLDADYACIEVDEFASGYVFSRLKPHCVVFTNLFRDQLDRFGEVDAVLDRLKEAVMLVPDAALVLNGDDAVSYSLSYGCGNPVVSYGIGKEFLRDAPGDNTWESVRESAFCRLCGEPLEYDYHHYGQLGGWHCPKCGARRPRPDYSAEDVERGKGEFTFRVVSCGAENAGRKGLGMKKRGRRLSEGEKPGALGGAGGVFGVKFAYDIYNVLSAYAALAAMDAVWGFGEAMKNYRYGNRRESMFVIGGGQVQLHLAKNPMGFQQKLSYLQQDPRPKDVVIQINDTELDGQDVSWLWDVDFQTLGDVSVGRIVVGGTRRYDMGLRLKYEGLLWDFTSDLQKTVLRLAQEGTGNLYVIVNYSGLYRMNHILKGLENSGKLRKEARGHEVDCGVFISKSAQFVR